MLATSRRAAPVDERKPSPPPQRLAVSRLGQAELLVVDPLPGSRSADRPRCTFGTCPLARESGRSDQPACLSSPVGCALRWSTA